MCDNMQLVKGEASSQGELQLQQGLQELQELKISGLFTFSRPS